MRLTPTLCFATLLVLASAPAIAGDAAYCLGVCGNRCYTSPNQAACNQACTSQCINQGSGTSGSTTTHGAIYVATPPADAVGWSWDAANSSVAQSAAGRNCYFGNNNTPCTELITYTDACGVAVHARDSSKHLLGVFGSARPAKAAAEKEALGKCSTRFPKATCKIVVETCSNDR